MVRILPMGERALLVETDSLHEVLGLRDRLAASRPPGVEDLVPAARTVLVPFDPRVLHATAVRAWIEAALTRGIETDAATAVAAPITLEVTYDGPDLAETAALLGLSAPELISRHTHALWTVAFTGFAPGFGYLVSPDWRFDVPRLAAPRTRVPAGAVAVAGEFTGAYPRETPGGWRLIGTTSAPLFAPDAATPALLSPGTPVRFRVASEEVSR